MSSYDEDAIVREIMARGRAKKAVAQGVPEDITPYDEEIPAIEQVLEVINSRVGTMGNLEAFRTEIIERFAEVNWKVEVEVHEVEFDDGEKIYQFNPILLGRIQPLNRSGETDFDKRRWEVVNDPLGIAPDMKGKTMPFSEAMLHGGSALADPNN